MRRPGCPVHDDCLAFSRRIAGRGPFDAAGACIVAGADSRGQSARPGTRRVNSCPGWPPSHVPHFTRHIAGRLLTDARHAAGRRAFAAGADRQPATIVGCAAAITGDERRDFTATCRAPGTTHLWAAFGCGRRCNWRRRCAGRCHRAGSRDRRASCRIDCRPRAVDTGRRARHRSPGRSGRPIGAHLAASRRSALRHGWTRDQPDGFAADRAIRPDRLTRTAGSSASANAATGSAGPKQHRRANRYARRRDWACGFARARP